MIQWLDFQNLKQNEEKKKINNYSYQKKSKDKRSMQYT